MSMKIDSRGRSPMNYTMETNLATHAGAFLKIPFNKHLAFKPGVDLIVRGAGRSERERLNIYYIDLPLSLQFDIGKKLYIEAGPVASLRVAARSYSYAYQNRITVSPSVEPFALGVSASVGYFVTQKLAFRGGVYSAITKAWDVSYRDVDNRPDGSVSYFPGNVSVGVEYNFTR